MVSFLNFIITIMSLSSLLLSPRRGVQSLVVPHNTYVRRATSSLSLCDVTNFSTRGQLSPSLGRRRSLLHSSSPLSTTQTSLFSSSTKASPPPDQTSTTATKSKQQSTTDLPKVHLKRNRQSRAFRDGSQLIFAGSVANVSSKTLEVGDIVQIEVPRETKSNNKKGNNKNDDGDKETKQQQQKPQTQLIGWGVYNPNSMYRVRILCHAEMITSKQLKKKIQEEESNDPDSLLLQTILEVQFTKALQTRQIALGLPTESTNTYRLINGEGDSVSGLAVDIVGGKVAVVMSSAAWCEIHKSTILNSLRAVLPDGIDLVWRTTQSRLRQDGYLEKKEDEHHEEEEEGESTPIIALENGVKYETYPYSQASQKTSVYCDQRENRYHFGNLCNSFDSILLDKDKKKKVLDLCCYHGGFSLNAAKYGGSTDAIEKIVGVDSSQDAIDICNQNAKLNEFDDVIEFVRDDIARYMQNCNESFDIIVLDPPKLAPSVAGLDKATRKYHSLNRDAIKLINEDTGGLFMTCTCSAAMTQNRNQFLQMVQQASLSAKRQLTLLKINGAASCHTQSPISYPAGNYLTAALFYVHPK